jgi:hypothetical protein
MFVSISSVLFIFAAHLPAAKPLALQVNGQDDNVPVTIKELDVAGAITEFKNFQTRLGEFREEISEGRAVAQETAQILEELRQTASPENGYNEEPILEAVTTYVDRVIEKQIGLVDFLESQRYRISYYAAKMASSVRPEHLALLFGTVEQNDAAIAARVRSLELAREDLATFVDGLPDDQLDKDTFRPLRGMPTETKRQLDALLYRYQQERGALEFAKKRLQLVRAAQRTGEGNISPASLDIDTDLLVGQMFGALDRVRLQMSMDLMFLENLLSGYAQSTRTQEIVEAFQSLIELQGDLEGPSPELAGVLDWLQDSSTRRLSMGASAFATPGLDVPRYGDLLREAYLDARSQE